MFVAQHSLCPANGLPRTPKRACRYAALACVLALGGIAHADDWPVVDMPNGVRPFDVGRQITLQGTPMRIRGFVSPLPPKAVAAAFRRSLGKPIVENVMAGKLVLGRGQAEHYIVVEIEAAASGSRGLVAVSQLKTAYDNRLETRASTERWLARLPAGSRLLSRMESEDAGRLSRHLVVANGLDASANRERLIAMLADEGLTFEREGTVDADSAPRARQSLVDSRMLFFKGPGKEAIATLHRDDAGQTTLVLNVVTSLERVR